MLVRLCVDDQDNFFFGVVAVSVVVVLLCCGAKLNEKLVNFYNGI